MYLSVQHHGPSGQSLSVIEFVLIWLREIVILVLSVTVIIVYLLLNLSTKSSNKTEASSVNKEESEN